MADAEKDAGQAAKAAGDANGIERNLANAAASSAGDLSSSSEDESVQPQFESIRSGPADPSPYQAAERIGTINTATDDDERTVPDDSGDSNPEDVPEPPPPAPKKPKQPILTRILGLVGLDVRTATLMFKGSLPPIIAIAWYQATPIAKIYANLGYLVPIITVMFMAILPRGKFIQTALLNVFAICLAAAFSLLALYCGIQARKHTSGPLTQADLAYIQAKGRAPYNSSCSAVFGIWLFFLVWLSNTVRARNAHFTLPSIIFSILVNITCTYGPMFLEMSQAESLIRQLIRSMLTSAALAVGVSLFIFPMSSRQIIMLQFAGMVGLLRKSVGLQGAYLRGLEHDDIYTLATVDTAVGGLGPLQDRQENKRRWWMLCFGRRDKAAVKPQLTREQKSAQALRATLGAMHELQSKMQAELKFAKRDAAYGKLSAHDLGEIARLLHAISVPVTGMSTIMDMFRRTAEARGWGDTANATEDELLVKERERHAWSKVMRQLHHPFAVLAQAVDEGLHHAGLQLELTPRSKEQKIATKAARQKRQAEKHKGGQAKGQNKEGSPSSGGIADDVEANAESTPRPGDEGFAAVLDSKVQSFYTTRSETLRVWARERDLIEHLATTPDGQPGVIDPMLYSREVHQTQLFVLLYMEQLIHATGEAVQDLVSFADKKVADGTMDKTRLLFPTLRRLGKFFTNVAGPDDATGEDSAQALKRDIANNNVIFVGDGFGGKKDPEHLPPKNAWQRFGNVIRAIFGLLCSPESAFGLRAAVATMCIAILCYLEKTHNFFQEQRIVWALIMVAISMTQTSGQSIFGFLLRVGGTIVAMVLSLIIWYIVDEHRAGAIVFLWVSIFCDFYFLIKFPRFIPAATITIITQVLIIGYEVQVEKIGVKASEITGQKWYPTSELAPFRLATVVAGLFVAFVWTIFPQPMSDRTWLRRDLSATMYLMANFFSVVNETLKAGVNDSAGDPAVEGTPASHLARVRQKIVSKLMALLPSIQSHADWQRYEPSIGGEFPRAQYEDIILRLGRILNYLSLISYTVSWRPRHGAPRDRDMWMKTLGELLRAVGPTHYTILSTLSTLSSSLLSGQSLPPYIPLPRPYELTRQLLAVKNDHPESAPRSSGVGSRFRRSKNRRGTFSNPKPTGKGMYDLRSEETEQPDLREEVNEGRGAMLTRSMTYDPSGSARSAARRQRTETTIEEAADRGGRHSLAEEDNRPQVQATLSRINTADDRTAGGVYTGGWNDMMNASTGVNAATGYPTLAQAETKNAEHMSALVDARNMEQQGYTEFAVLQVCTTLICDDLEGLIQAVSGLVGVVDFSFRIDASDTSLNKEKGKGKKD